jgi:hypothetical protein
MRNEGEVSRSNIQRLDLPENPLRHTVVILLREQLEKEVETEFLVDWTEDMWATIDTLIARFGIEQAHKIIHARLGITSFVGEVS